LIKIHYPTSSIQYPISNIQYPKMPITTNNYEVFFVDYHDGALSPGQVAELFLFLEQHPELKEEFEGMAGIRLGAMEESFPEKESLKRGLVTAGNLDWYLVAGMEGDLDAKSSDQLNKYLDAHPARRRDETLFRATRLEPGHEVFAGKKDLKKPVPFSVTYRAVMRYAVAAMLLLGVIGGSAYLLNQSGIVPEERMAQKNVHKVIGQEPVSERKAQMPSVQDRLEQSTGISSAQSMDEQPAGGDLQKPSVRQDVSEVIPPSMLASGQIQPADVVPAAVIPPVEIVLALDQSIQAAPTATPRADIRPADADEEYMTVWEALRKVSSREAKRLTGQPAPDEALAYADQPAPGLAELVGSGLGKLTNEKVSYSARSDEEGRKSGFRFNIGGISIEK
jgi:hypothetical protein